MRTKECPTCEKEYYIGSFMLWWVEQKECLTCREKRGIQAFIDLGKMVEKIEN